MKQFRLNTQTKGFSLIELMLVMVVLVIFIAAAYVMFGTGQEGARSDQAQKNLMGLHAGTKRICQRAGQCPTLTQATLISAAQAPSDMINGTALQSPWGGVVTVAVVAGAFQYTFAAVPKAECNTFVSAVQNNFTTIAVGATTVKSTTVPYLTDTTVAACGVAAVSSIVFTAS